MRTRLGACIAALALAGCAVLEPPQPTPVPQLAGVPSSFDMSGRIAVRVGNESNIARLRWTRTQGRDAWVVSSPLGNEVARIESTPSGATLARAGDGTDEAPSFEDLTARLLGVALDPAWLAQGLHGTVPRGLPAGWEFTIEETQPAGSVQLAKRITVRRGDTVVRLVVDTYQALGD